MKHGNPMPEDKPLSSKKPKIGVVVASGGLKCLGAIELFSYLESIKLPIDLLVGCSGGAIVCGTYSFKGEDINELKRKILECVSPSLFSTLDYSAFAGLLHLPLSRFDEKCAFFKPDHLLETYQNFFKGATFEDIKIPLVIQTTNVYTGKGVVFSSGDLADIIYASGALAPFFPPIMINGQLLADGVFSNSTPVVEAVKRNMDIIIAMTFEENSTLTPTSLLDFSLDFLGKTHLSLSYVQNASAISMHHHEIIFINVKYNRNIRIWDIEALPLIYETTKKAIEDHKETIENAVYNFQFFDES